MLRQRRSGDGTRGPGRGCANVLTNRARGGARLVQNGSQEPGSSFPPKRPGDEGIRGAANCLLDLIGERGFQFVAIEVNLTGGDLVRCCAVEAQFADAKTAFDAQRRAEDAAGHRASGVEIAETGRRIESGARLVVGKVLEEIGLGFIQGAGYRIARELRREARDRFFGAGANGGGARRIGSGEGVETFAQTSGVEL